MAFEFSGTRIDQLIEWAGGTEFDGVMVFDECHKAKNIGDTKTSEYVISLQDRLPMARVLYCSATGVSDVKHMVYANRLNLWGPSTAYPQFKHFEDMLNKRGIGGLEMLSLEMKMQGRFIARTLSWDGAIFETCEFQLSGEVRLDGERRMGRLGGGLSNAIAKNATSIRRFAPRSLRRNIMSPAAGGTMLARS